MFHTRSTGFNDHSLIKSVNDEPLSATTWSVLLRYIVYNVHKRDFFKVFTGLKEVETSFYLVH